MLKKIYKNIEYIKEICKNIKCGKKIKWNVDFLKSTIECLVQRMLQI